MKKITELNLLIIVWAMSGCQAVGSIFKGGMWFGIFLVVAVLVLILYMFRRISK